MKHSEKISSGVCEEFPLAAFLIYIKLFYWEYFLGILITIP